MRQIHTYMDVKEMLMSARRGARSLQKLTDGQTDDILRALAQAIRQGCEAICRANAIDLESMAESDPKRDRLLLTPGRIEDMAQGIDDVADLPSPLGRILSRTTRPNGMEITKVSVPFGVIGVIYEARPNVTVDVAALCLKAGSAVVLKGGHQAGHTNRALAGIIHNVLKEYSLPTAAVTLLADSRDATAALISATGVVDLIIPRGGKALIEWVRDNSRVPVIETGAGVCHTYLHCSGRTDYARQMVLNAKTRRPSVCNSLDTLLVDECRLGDLPQICAPLADCKVEIHADTQAYRALEGHYPYLCRADAGDFGREWLDFKMTVATVDQIDEALDWIDRYGSHHSEAIVAEDPQAQQEFCKGVDAACVYVNVSTAFTDGGQFGFGAEIGISTQKLHARGPMALPEITTYKYIITGQGQTR